MRTGTCSICDTEGEIVEHHTSYSPEKKILVCLKCHEEIHHKDSKLKPKSFPMNMKRISFVPTDTQRERLKKIPRNINLSKELRLSLDALLDKYVPQNGKQPLGKVDQTDGGVKA